MRTTTCRHCDADHYWSWDEAVDKFGFGGGDGLVETETVANVLCAAGYAVAFQRWGCHNVVITKITGDGRELIPDDANVGYDDPREYLPAAIVELLDREFGADHLVRL